MKKEFRCNGRVVGEGGGEGEGRGMVIELQGDFIQDVYGFLVVEGLMKE